MRQNTYKLFANAALAAKAANSQARIAAMLTYVSALLSGTAEPFWPHFVLISGSVLAGIAVGAGIIFESSEYSASVHRVAKWLVIVGVVIESVCTICLFVFDEGISGIQQSKIIALETRLAPRTISREQRERIIEKMKEFAGQEFSGRVASGSEDAWDLWREISLALDLAGWKRLPPVPPIGTPPYGPSSYYRYGRDARSNGLVLSIWLE